MSNLTFNINSSNEFLQKLIQEVEEYEKNLESSRHAINAAMNAWHLVDWTYYELGIKANFENYKKTLKKRCPSLQIMQDITNGSKHLKLTYTPKTKDTSLKKGAFSNDFSRGFDISRLQVTIGNQTKNFINELEIVRDFWIEYLNEKKT